MKEKIPAVIDQILGYTLDDFSYGIPIYAVIKVYHAVEGSPLLKAPKIICSVSKVKGKLIRRLIFEIF